MDRTVVSFSGGKDSTAVLLMLIEQGQDPFDIVWFDTGWEFPEMYDHVAKVESYIGRQVTRLNPPKPFNHWLLDREVRYLKGSRKGRLKRFGNGWPSPFRRWCTRIKIQAIDYYLRGLSQRADVGRIWSAIGYGADECFRPEKPEAIKARKGGALHYYPLIEWGVTEADALAYCRARGFDWGGLYDHFHRVSCFCCPLQSLANLRLLRTHRPALWQQMLDWEREMDPTQETRFHHEASVHDLEKRFAGEEEEAGP